MAESDAAPAAALSFASMSQKTSRRRLSVVPVDALVALVTLLRLERQGGDRAGLQALDGDGLAGLLAIAVGAVVDPADRSVDLGDQLALAVARAQL